MVLRKGTAKGKKNKKNLSYCLRESDLSENIIILTDEADFGSL